MPREQTPVSLGDVEVLRETERAILVRRVDEGDEIWIPSSQVHPDSEVWSADDEGELIVNEWWAEKEGLV